MYHTSVILIHLELIYLDILTGASIEDVRVGVVFLVKPCSKCPDDILQTHRWLLEGTAVHGLQVSARADDGEEAMVKSEVMICPTLW